MRALICCRHSSRCSDVKLVDGQCTSSNIMGVCTGDDMKLVDGVCKLKYGVGSLQTTSTTPWQGGNDRLQEHTLDCGSNGLNQFHLERQANPQTNWEFWYNFRCLQDIESPANIDNSTPSTTYTSTKIGQLESHDIDCGTHPISKFRLNKPTATTYSYDYTCNSSEALGPCREVTTDWAFTEHNVHLDSRHNVKCEPGEVITRFKLEQHPTEERMRYQYTCCRMSAN